MHSDELMRGAELREGLELDLASHPELSPIGRVVWLATNLEEYVGRLVGFGMFPHTTLGSLIRGVLFSMVVVASELVTREMENASLPAPLLSDWQSFVDVLAALPEKTDKRELDELMAITNFRVALESLEEPG